MYNSGCEGTDAGECVSCTDPAEGFYWTSDGNLEDACGEAECVDTCPSGTFLDGCGGTSPGNCTSCPDTDPGFLFNSSATGCAQIPCSATCNAGYYLTGTCSNAEDYVCAPCITSMDCTDGYAVVTPCDGTGFEDAVCESINAITYTCDSVECGVERATSVWMEPDTGSVVLAGDEIIMSAPYAFADGYNHVLNSSATNAVISGGQMNSVLGADGGVFGGREIYGKGDYGAVLGGRANRVGGEHNIVLGGQRNDVCDYNSKNEEDKCGADSSSGSGFNNDIPGKYSSIGGGYGNTAVNDYIGIMAGRRNRATSNFCAAPGGYLNKCVGRYGSVIGGSRNTATGKYSVSFGWYTRAASQRAAVFSFSGDGKDRVCRSLGENSINVCTKSGFFINNLNLETLVENQRRRALESLSVSRNADTLATLSLTVDKLESELVTRRAMVAQLRAQMEQLKAQREQLGNQVSSDGN